jgi:hypothetical protein
MADIDKKFQKLIDNYEEHCRRIAKASVVDIHERPADKIARVKRIEKDYVTWFEYYFPNYAKVPCAWFHRQGAQEIIDNDVIMALWEIYRSGAKSVHVDMGIPLYLMYTGRLRYMLLIGETEDKAHKLLSACQARLPLQTGRLVVRGVPDLRRRTLHGSRFRSGPARRPRGGAASRLYRRG